MFLALIFWKMSIDREMSPPHRMWCAFQLSTKVLEFRQTRKNLFLIVIDNCPQHQMVLSHRSELGLDWRFARRLWKLTVAELGSIAGKELVVPSGLNCLRRFPVAILPIVAPLTSR